MKSFEDYMREAAELVTDVEYAHDMAYVEDTARADLNHIEHGTDLQRAIPPSELTSIQKLKAGVLVYTAIHNSNPTEALQAAADVLLYKAIYAED